MALMGRGEAIAVQLAVVVAAVQAAQQAVKVPRIKAVTEHLRGAVVVLAVTLMSLAVVLFKDMGVLVPQVQYASYGLANQVLPESIHQPTQVTCNGFIYSYCGRAAF